MFFNLFVFRPICKYFEYAWGSTRINITVVSLLIFLIFSFFFLIYIIKNRFYISNNKPLLIISILLLYLTFLQLINYPYLIEYKDIFLKTISNTIIHYWVLFIIGVYIFSLLDSNTFKIMIVISWIISFLIMGYFCLANEKGFYLILNEAPIYLMLADSFAILSILTICIIKKHILKVVLFFLSTIILFALFSRASLYCFICIFIIYLLRKNKKTLIFIIILLTILVSQIDIFETLQISKEDRMLKLLYTIGDNSRKERKVLFKEGLESIKHHWVTGDYMGDVIEHNGRKGNYIHNYLSFLRQFGIIPFIIFCFITLYFYIRSTIEYLFRKISKNFEFVFLYFTFVFLEIVVARSFVTPYIWLAISASAVYFSNKQYREKI